MLFSRVWSMGYKSLKSSLLSTLISFLGAWLPLSGLIHTSLKPLEPGQNVTALLILPKTFRKKHGMGQKRASLLLLIHLLHSLAWRQKTPVSVPSLLPLLSTALSIKHAAILISHPFSECCFPGSRVMITYQFFYPH